MHGFTFTERVRRVFAIAQDECVRMRYDYLDTEHLLLGIIFDGEGVAVAALNTFHVDFQEVVNSVKEKPPKPNRAAMSQIDVPFTSRAKKVLELSMAEAQDLDHRYVGTEHLILGLLRVGRGLASQILVKQGVTLESLRTEILQLLGTEAGARNANMQSHTLRPVRPEIVSVTVEVRLANGTVVRNESRNALVAMAFLRRQLGQPDEE